MINKRKIKKLAVIIVNAATKPEENFEKDPSPPGLEKVGQPEAKSKLVR